MGDQGPQMLTAEPNFMGCRSSDGNLAPGSCSAEDFITRVDDLQRASQWTDERAAQHVRGFLREEAAEWFNHTLLMRQPALREAALASYNAFKTAFKDRYFSIKSRYDVSTDWANLRQRAKELPSAFADRVLAVVHRYAALFEPCTLEAPTTELLRDGLVACGESTLVQRNLFNGILQRVLDQEARRNQLAIVTDLSVKMITQGLKSPRLQDLVRDGERKHHDIHRILNDLAQAEKSDRGEEQNARNKTTIPKVSEIGDGQDDNDYLSDGEEAAVEAAQIAALAKYRSQKGARGGGQARKGNGAKNPNGSNTGGNAQQAKKQNGELLRTKAGELAYCKFCKSRIGHLEKDCAARLKALGKSTAASAKVSAVSQESTAPAEKVLLMAPAAFQKAGKAEAGL